MTLSKTTAERKASPDRLGAFSDGVIAVIITIMLLELKAPHEATLAALAALWPTFASYTLSYFFIAIVWVNHHHLLRYAQAAEPSVIWSNFGFLFSVSLIPFFTSWLADSRMAPAPTALYAANFLFVTFAHSLFETAIARQSVQDQQLKAKLRSANRRNWFAALVYSLAIPAAWLHPACSLALILGVSLLYFAPEAGKRVTQGRPALKPGRKSS
jgi:uncharacterized membrane protein